MTFRISHVSLVAVFGATPALAHTGHLIEAAGHSHWGALIALGGAVAVGLWGARGKKKPESEEIEAEDDVSEAEPQEA